MSKFRFKRKSTHAKPEKKQAVVLSLNSKNRGLDLLVELVKKIRPSSSRKKEETELKFRALLYQLQQDRSLLFGIRRALLSQFTNSDIIPALTESGIIHSRGFVQELTGKIKHKIIPSLQKPNDFLYVINHVFYKKNDYQWVESIDKNLWKEFFEMLGIQINLTEPLLFNQLNGSLQILSYRITALAMEKEVMEHLDMTTNAIQPFIEQNRLVNLYLERFKSQGENENKIVLINIEEALYNCKQSVEWLREQRGRLGTSLAQTFLMVRLQQQLERLFIILDVLDKNLQFNTERFINYFYTVVRNENRKNSLGEFLSANLGLLAYQIAEHKERKGEQYIAITRKDFRSLFKSALGGGFIISFAAILKTLIGKIKMPLFWQGFLYSANYSLGFLLIDRTRSTLATKQPAYTASAVAGSLDKKKNDEPDLRNLAITVARVSRSQIASFAGNLVVVFPLTYLLAWLFFQSTGNKLAEADTAMKMLSDQHPVNSLALLYACFTGFFLFLSGLIAGYVENHVAYGRIGQRLKTHPVFVNTFSSKRLARVVNLVEKSSGMIAGSIALGFFLGTAGSLGKFLGIPFDIRHITISAANASIGFFGLDHNVSISYLLVILLGVLLIGFLNFFVSFACAFFVAVRSRGIKLKEYPEFLGILGRYFRRHPKDFLLPPKTLRVPEELK
jgi:site-specific recombinase